MSQIVKSRDAYRQCIYMFLCVPATRVREKRVEGSIHIPEKKAQEKGELYELQANARQ